MSKKIIIYEGIKQAGCTFESIKRYKELEAESKSVCYITKDIKRSYADFKSITNYKDFNRINYLEILSLSCDYLIFDKCGFDENFINENIEYNYLNYDRIINRLNGDSKKINDYISFVIKDSKMAENE